MEITHCCIVFLTAPQASVKLCEALARIKNEVMVAMAIPADMIGPPDLETACRFELSPVTATEDCAVCVVLKKEVRHVASESPLPRREPCRQAFWLGSDRRWG